MSNVYCTLSQFLLYFFLHKKLSSDEQVDLHAFPIITWTCDAKLNVAN